MKQVRKYSAFYIHSMSKPFENKIAVMSRSFKSDLELYAGRSRRLKQVLSREKVWLECFHGTNIIVSWEITTYCERG